MKLFLLLLIICVQSWAKTPDLENFSVNDEIVKAEQEQKNQALLRTQYELHALSKACLAMSSQCRELSMKTDCRDEAWALYEEWAEMHAQIPPKIDWQFYGLIENDTHRLDPLTFASHITSDGEKQEQLVSQALVLKNLDIQLQSVQATCQNHDQQWKTPPIEPPSEMDIPSFGSEDFFAPPLQ